MERPSPFEGDLVRLRAREPEDEPLSYEWFNDPEVTEFLTLRYPLSHKNQREFLDAHSTPGHSGASFAIVAKADETYIGGCDLAPTSAENRSASLGIAIGDKKHWDGGYGTDAMRTLCQFGFEHMNLHRIELEVYAGNERARHVYERVGFQVEACRRRAHFKYGEYMDVYIMGLLEGELRLTP